MVFYTGDIHGQKYEIERFCKRFHPTRDDVIVILGDVGANYSQNERDAELKTVLERVKPTILCIHGNHEIRPWNIPTYKTMPENLSLLKAYFDIENAPAETGARRKLHHRIFKKVFDIATENSR